TVQIMPLMSRPCPGSSCAASMKTSCRNGGFLRLSISYRCRRLPSGEYNTSAPTLDATTSTASPIATRTIRFSLLWSTDIRVPVTQTLVDGARRTHRLLRGASADAVDGRTEE